MILWTVLNTSQCSLPLRRRTFKELVREIDCPQCNRKYATRSSLATHMRLKHAMELEPLRMCEALGSALTAVHMNDPYL